MAFDQIPDEIDVAVFDDEPLRGAIFSPSSDGILQYVRAAIYIRGTISGSERVRVKLHSSERYSAPFALSDWSSLSDISNLSDSWLGFVRFDFNDNQIDGSLSAIYAEIEIENYTRNGDSFYVGLFLDRNDPSNIVDGQWGAPPKMEFYWKVANAYS